MLLRALVELAVCVELSTCSSASTKLSLLTDEAYERVEVARLLGVFGSRPDGSWRLQYVGGISDLGPKLAATGDVLGVSYHANGAARTERLDKGAIGSDEGGTGAASFGERTIEGIVDGTLSALDPDADGGHGRCG